MTRHKIATIAGDGIGKEVVLEGHCHVLRLWLE
jgi:isocitrate/isopropylmalate dehydrogenase